MSEQKNAHKKIKTHPPKSQRDKDTNKQQRTILNAMILSCAHENMKYKDTFIRSAHLH